MTSEDAELLQQALHCADQGSCTHWPTAAGILAAEVRLRAHTLAERIEDELAYDRHPQAVLEDVLRELRGVADREGS